MPKLLTKLVYILTSDVFTCFSKSFSSDIFQELSHDMYVSSSYRSDGFDFPPRAYLFFAALELVLSLNGTQAILSAFSLALLIQGIIHRFLFVFPGPEEYASRTAGVTIGTAITAIVMLTLGLVCIASYVIQRKLENEMQEKNTCCWQTDLSILCYLLLFFVHFISQ